MRDRPRLRLTGWLASVAALVLVAAVLGAAPGTDLRIRSLHDAALAAGAADADAADGAIEPYVRGEGRPGCDPREREGVRAFRDLVLGTYDRGSDGGIVRDCAIGGASEHKDGRAWDWMLDARDPGDAAVAEEVIGWLLATDEAGEPHAIARRLGLKYLIWDGRIWSATRGATWHPYRGVSPHTDHVHFSFGREGAEGETSFWAPVWEPEVGATYPAVDGEGLEQAGPGSPSEVPAAVAG